MIFKNLSLTYLPVINLYRKFDNKSSRRIHAHLQQFNGGKQVIDPKEGPGKEGVLVLAFGLTKDQYGDWHAGLRSPILEPANASNLFLLLSYS